MDGVLCCFLYFFSILETKIFSIYIYIYICEIDCSKDNYKEMWFSHSSLPPSPLPLSLYQHEQWNRIYSCLFSWYLLNLHYFSWRVCYLFLTFWSLCFAFALSLLLPFCRRINFVWNATFCLYCWIQWLWTNAYWF